MKTSNKLLLIAIIFILVMATGVLATVKSHMVKVEPNILDGSGEIVRKKLGVLGENVMLLDTDYEYYFDPNSNDIFIEGDENIIRELSDCINFDPLNTMQLWMSCGLLEEYVDVVPSVDLKFSIGVAQYSELNIHLIEPRYSKKEFTLNLLRSSTHHYSRVEINSYAYNLVHLNVESKELRINASYHSKMNVTGAVTKLIAKLDVQSVFNAKELELDSVFVTAESSTIELSDINYLSGYLEDGQLSYTSLQDTTHLIKRHTELLEKD